MQSQITRANLNQKLKLKSTTARQKTQLQVLHITDEVTAHYSVTTITTVIVVTEHTTFWS